jgi:NADH:ubiquinone reductase (H+-translocating)
VGTVRTFESREHHVVVVGGGFGGLQAVKKLRRLPVEVTLVDRRNFHLFQPLTYQVATGALSPGEIAHPLRAIFKRDRNVRVLLAEVADFDLDARELQLRSVSAVPAPERLGYDTLIVAGGGHYSYFGHEEWRTHAAEVKSLESALAVRSRLLAAFEAAEAEPNADARAAWLTFVVVGAGPTGVEMAGQIAELANQSLRRNFRRIDPSQARILLVDAAPRILGTFDERLASRAAAKLEKLGVEIQVGALVTGVDSDGIELRHGDGETERIEAMAKIWSAGVQASPLGAILAEASGAGLTRSGQVMVEPDCTLPGHPEVFLVGDLMALNDLPGLAEVAMQSGRHAASEIRRRLDGETEPRPFHYVDLGALAAISRWYAIGERGRIRIWGFIGWLVWLVVHITFLTGFKNRASALFHWIVSFFGRGRGERTITMQQVLARRALEVAADEAVPPRRARSG